MTYELVIFDCDGVLVDSERLVTRIESATLARVLGLMIAEDELRARFKGKTTAEVAAGIERELGKPAPPDFMYEWAMATAEGFVRELEPVPGVEAVLERLARAGTTLCVASQSPLPRVRLSLRLTALERFFGERVYTASMVARPKPAPDLFLHAAAGCGVEPARCAVVEDSASGVTAARAAGIDVFGYAGDEAADVLAAAGAVTFASMNELPELLGLAAGG